MSTVIFLVIIAIWAVVLIPMWLRRHDEVEEARSVDRFSSAMHTLSRKDREAAAVDRKYAVMPHRSRSLEVHVSGASDPDVRPAKKRAPERVAAPHRSRPQPVQRRRRASAAARRRRTLIGFAGIAVVSLIGAVVVGGIALWGLQLIVDLLIVGFVFHLRTQAKLAAARPPRRRSAPAAGRSRSTEGVAADEAYYEDEVVVRDAGDRWEPVPVRAPAVAVEPLFDQTAVVDTSFYGAAHAESADPVYDDELFDQSAEFTRVITFDPTPVEAPAALFDQEAEPEVIATPEVAASGRYDVYDVDLTTPEPARQPERDVALDTTIGSRPWEPVPVPRPIYASKPPAFARPSRAPSFEPLLPPIDTAAELDPVEDLEEILDRRWAVND